MGDDLKPKVFISYAWTNDEYANKVYEFVKRLRNDGIETLFDQFDLRPGNSLHNFMEKCVSDSSVTNVLILLNPDYKKKADERKGGAGIETQIISEEVYKNLENTKFVPVIFDLGEKQIQDVVPIYLKSRFFIDLSNLDLYEDHYRSLVRHLYGKPAMLKNIIGSKPSWVDDSKSASYDIDKLEWVSNSMSQGNEKVTYRKTLLLLMKEVKKYLESFSYKTVDYNNFEDVYSSLSPLKNLIIGCINELVEMDNISSFVEEFFETYNETISIFKNNCNWKYLMFKLLAHELVVSIVAIMYRSRKYYHIFNIVSYPYLARDQWQTTVSFNAFFYSLSEGDIYTLDEHLGKIKYKDDNGYKLTGIGDYWIRNLSFDFLTRQEFVNADILLSNLCGILLGRRWFSLTYVYSRGNPNWVYDISKSMKTRSSFSRFKPLFGNFDEAKIKKLLEEDSKNNSRHFGYVDSYNSIPMIVDYIDVKTVFEDE